MRSHHRLAFAAYEAALDRERQAAETYAGLTRRVGELASAQPAAALSVGDERASAPGSDL